MYKPPLIQTAALHLLSHKDLSYVLLPARHKFGIASDSGLISTINEFCSNPRHLSMSDIESKRPEVAFQATKDYEKSKLNNHVRVEWPVDAYPKHLLNIIVPKIYLV
jgi:hypothetical protein